jgi:hypothetical protein
MRAPMDKASTHFAADARHSVVIVKFESVAFIEGEGEMTNDALRPRRPANAKLTRLSIVSTSPFPINKHYSAEMRGAIQARPTFYFML